MILIACTFCTNAIQISSSQPGEIEGMFFTLPGWPLELVCPTCGKTASGYHANEVSEAARSMMQVRDLNPVEAHAALHGLGFPEERKCTGADVLAVLMEHPVRHVRGKEVVGTNRFCIDHLELWDGTRVYFGSSSHGAIIYRISKPHSYVEAANG